MAKTDKETHLYRLFAIGAARDFNYGDEVIENIKKSTSKEEISKYLEKARLATC